MSKGRILLVEPDDKLQERLEYGLREEGYTVTSTNSEIEAISIIAVYDVLYCNKTLNIRDFITMAQTINKNLSVIMAHEQDFDDDKIADSQWMGQGGYVDDYIKKPFFIGELKARIRFLIQRNKKDD